MYNERRVVVGKLKGKGYQDGKEVEAVAMKRYQAQMVADHPKGGKKWCGIKRG